MNEPTLTPAPEQVVPVPVPASVPPPLPAPRSAPVFAAVPEPRPAAPSPSEDQLPTARVQSIPAVLPPPVPPQGPAHKTQPLRAISRDDATARLAQVARRRPWQTVLAHVKRTAAAIPARFRGVRSEAWTGQHVGLAAAAVGVAMILAALVLGWQSVALERFEKVEHASLAVAVVLARAALAISAMAVGYGLLRMGERTLTTVSNGLPRAHEDSDARRR